MTVLLWLALPLGAVVITLLALRLRPDEGEFREVAQRSKAMARLSTMYDPTKDAARKRPTP